MRILLDENLDRRLKQEFHSSIAVETVAERGWNGKKNGELLTLAAVDFDAFVTADQNLKTQQNIANYDIAVFVLVAPTNRLADHQPLIPQLENELHSARPGTLTTIEAKSDE
jgi:hypothetical protein